MLYGYRQLVVHVKTDDIYKDIGKDFEKRFGTSNYEIDRPFPKGKNKIVIGLMKDELGGQIMKEFVGLRSKMYWYSKENNDENIKAKGTKKCVVKTELKFQDYKTCLRVSQIKNIKNYSAKNKLI